MNFLRSFLDNDSIFGQVMYRLWILILCNVLFVISLVLVIPAGAGWAAMDYTLMKASREKDEISPLRDFFQEFKESFVQATIVWGTGILIAAFLLLEWFWCTQFGGFFLEFRYLLIAIGMVVYAVFIYIFPVMAAFKGNIREHIRDSAYFAFHKPFILLIVLFLHIFPMFLTYSDLSHLPLYAFLWCFMGFSALEMMTVSFLLKDFAPFLEKEAESRL